MRNGEKVVKLLVIGRSGQLARAMAARSAASLLAGVEVRCIGRPEVSISDEASLERVLSDYRPDVVLNAAANTAVDEAEEDEGKVFEVNAIGLVNLANVCKGIGARLIHVSTDYVFDGHVERLLKETDRVGPLNAYGRSKLAGEWAVHSILPDSIIIRASWVYSEFGRNFVRSMLTLAERVEEVSVVNDQYGRPTYVYDLCDLVLAIVEKVERPGGELLGGVYHFSNGGDVVSWYDFAKSVFEHAARVGLKRPESLLSITSDQYPTPARRPKWSAFDLEKTERTFGMSIPDWQRSLEKYFNKNYQSL